MKSDFPYRLSARVVAPGVVTAALALLTSVGTGAKAEPRPPVTPLPAFEPIEPLPPAPPPAVPRAPADVSEPPADATKTESGLATKVLVKAKGTTRPGPYDRVTVNYTGWTPGGRVVDSSIERGEPTTVSLDTVSKGWAEGLQLMVKGEKRRLWIPAALASRPKETPPGAGVPTGALVFDIELLDFASMPEPPQVPPDVEAAPKEAKKTASGLRYKMIKAGKGKEHPKTSSTVEVHYSGWTPDGKMFDSSVARGKPTSFSLDGVIKGWTEGVQLMVVGDKARFWIPGSLAYGDKPTRTGTPSGPLVFDIELLSIR